MFGKRTRNIPKIPQNKVQVITQSDKNYNQHNSNLTLRHKQMLK